MCTHLVLLVSTLLCLSILTHTCLQIFSFICLFISLHTCVTGCLFVCISVQIYGTPVLYKALMVLVFRASLNTITVLRCPCSDVGRPHSLSCVPGEIRANLDSPPHMDVRDGGGSAIWDGGGVVVRCPAEPIQHDVKTWEDDRQGLLSFGVSIGLLYMSVACLNVHMFINVSVHLLVRTFVCPVYLSNCASICLRNCKCTCMPICPDISIRLDN